VNRATTLVALGLAAALAIAVPSPAAPGDDILVIGDSLGVGMEPYLADALSGYDVRTDAEIGRGSAAGVDALERNLAPRDDVVVFALGSNDDPRQPQGLATSLEAAQKLAAGRCLIVATLETSELTGVPEEPLNRTIRAFAAANPNVRLVEWHDAVSPDLLVDGGHATPEGYGLRASLFADAIASCDGAAPPLGTGGRADGIPNPDRDALAEHRERRQSAGERSEPEPLSRDEAIRILADALSSQIAIGALGDG
jgi:lysophospholipase L1-like esterase